VALIGEADLGSDCRRGDLPGKKLPGGVDADLGEVAMWCEAEPPLKGVHEVAASESGDLG
jgi:hypothetical protein